MPDENIWKRVNSSIVPEGQPAVSVLAYLVGRFSYLNEVSWHMEIDGGKVLVNGDAAAESAVVHPGDCVSWAGREIEEPEVDGAYGIICENDRFFAVNKTGDLPVHPAGRYFNNTLSVMLEKRFGEKVFPVHRLDRETSGVVLFARFPEAASKLSVAIKSGIKQYAAIVHGNFPDDKIEIDVPLGPDGSSPVRKKRAAYMTAEEQAKTVFEKVAAFSGFSLVNAFPETGRLHQIRAHLEYAGYPIVGDKLYGGDSSRFLRFIDSGMTADLAAELILPRTALHAQTLSFTDPYTEKVLSLSAPLPSMFTEFIDRESRRG